MADINYWGLTGVKRSVTGITLATATVDTLITAIATDEGLPADYYHWSLLSDPSKNSITYGDSSTKLSTIGLVDGDTVSCTPQQNESKQERQIRKLEIAQAKRKAFGDITKPYYRVNNTYDLTLLPDTYATAADDNPNGEGGGTITNITIATPLTRLDGSNYANPGNVTIQFATPAAGGGLGTDKATGTPNIVAGKLAGITIVYGGTGYTKGITGLVSCDIFIIDSTPGNPDTREIRDGLPSGVDVTASDITSAGLLNGRPWVNYAGIAFASNIWRTDYEGYFNDVPSFFATAALKAAPNDYNGTDTTIAEPSLLNNTSIEYKGYFLATYTGTHTFYLASDDGSFMWVGPTALTGFTTANALVKNGGLHAVVEVSATISLVAGTYYPVRIQFGNGPSGPGALTASYEHSGQAKTSTWTGKIFYNTATNGF